MKAIAYIDGYNLYYGLLRGTPYKWLDLWKFCRTLLKPNIELEEVKYFTALVKPHPFDQAAVDRHQFKKQVVVFNPHKAVSKNLDWAASYYKNIPRDLPASCQLPDEISVGTKGHKLRRPERWA